MGRTSLHYAAALDNDDIYNMLKSVGAKEDAKDKVTIITCITALSPFQFCNFESKDKQFGITYLNFVPIVITSANQQKSVFL